MSYNKQTLNVYHDLCPCNSGKKIIDCCFTQANTTPPGPKTGYSHPQCYAGSLQDCSNSLSREHYFSKGILNLFDSKHVQVSGHPWGKRNEKKFLYRNNLASRVLCKRHNEALSGLDAIAQKFFRFVLGKTKEQCVMIIRGTEIERWMLKVYCGLLFSGIFIHDGIPIEKRVPGLDFLNTIFYKQDIPEGRGLLFNLSKEVQTRPGEIQWSALVHDGSIIGFQIKIEFFNMIFSFGPVQDYKNETETSRGMLYHPSAIIINSRDENREIHLGWPEGTPLLIKKFYTNNSI